MEYGNAAYLDIETTGVSMKNEITTIALFYLNEIRYFVNGINLSDFSISLLPVKRLMTFNGSRFDVPFLQLKYGVSFNLVHVDLKTLCRKKGLIGGLKRIGHTLGIERGEQCQSGKDAVLYWHRYVENGDLESLRELLIYNGNDVLILYQIILYLSGKTYSKSITAERFADRFIQNIRDKI